MADLTLDQMIEGLEKRIERQKQEGGDMFFYGNPDPLDVALLDKLKKEKENG